MKDVKNLGQYLTPEFVAEFMADLATCSPQGKVLEPACGEGVFLKILGERGFKDTVGFEVDPTLAQRSSAHVNVRSFISEEFGARFDLVIGNPPYVRWKNLDAAQKDELASNALWQRYFSSLSDYLCIFVLKSVELLKEGGELIFITPEYWFNTQHAQALRDYLVAQGDFTHIFHFKETPIFPNVSSSFVIFRFVRSKVSSRRIEITKYSATQRLTREGLATLGTKARGEKIQRFTRRQFERGSRWILAPEHTERTLRDFEKVCARGGAPALADKQHPYATVGDVLDIGNGMVSGLDKAFQLPADLPLTAREKNATLNVVKGKHLEPYRYTTITPYIFLPPSVTSAKELRTNYPNFYAQLVRYREALAARYDYNRTIKFWEWVFPRNLALFSRNQPRILVPCKERISHKAYVRFALTPAGLFPTQDVTGLLLKPGVRESPEYVVALLNTPAVFEWLSHNGVVKGSILEFSEKPLASTPLRLIDWKDAEEVRLHTRITKASTAYARQPTAEKAAALSAAVAELFQR